MQQRTSIMSDNSDKKTNQIIIASYKQGLHSLAILKLQHTAKSLLKHSSLVNI